MKGHESIRTATRKMNEALSNIECEKRWNYAIEEFILNTFKSRAEVSNVTNHRKILPRTILGLLLTCFAPVRANIIYDQPNGLTTPLDNDPRWNSTVQWNVASGTVIAPNYFLTAQHFDGSIGDPVSLTTTVLGVTTTTTYTTGTQYDIPNSDLRVIQIVGGTFPASSIVPLYSGAPGTEVGQAVSMFGYGPYVQGNPIMPGSVQNGWSYGGTYAPADYKNYGGNSVDAVVGGGPGGENMLEYTFGPSPGLSIYGPGDSGGGMFIDNNGTWQVAGVAYGVTQLYFKSGSTYVFMNGAIYNPAGLYVNNGTDADPDYELATVAQQGDASEIAPFESEIENITGVPEPASIALISFGALLLLRRRSQSREVR